MIMNTFSSLCALGAAATLALTAGCSKHDAARLPVAANATNDFKITGMHCDGCAQMMRGYMQKLCGARAALMSQFLGAQRPAR